MRPVGASPPRIGRAPATAPDAASCQRPRPRPRRRARRRPSCRRNRRRGRRRSSAPAPPMPVQAQASARRSPLRAREAGADLEQPDVALFAAAVVRHRVDEARQRRRPQHRKVLRQRIGDRHDVAVGARRARPPPRHEAERHRFGKPGAPSGSLRSWRARAIRGSIGRGADGRAPGNVTGRRSKP